MNPERKAEWVAALRSGDYPQGRNVLTSVESDGTRRHCCLGVLCDLAVKAGVLTVDTDDDGTPDTTYVNGTNAVRYHETGQPDAQAVVYLPRAVREWAGLDGDNPGFVREGFLNRTHLASLNDDGVSFDDIADVIDERF